MLALACADPRMAVLMLPPDARTSHRSAASTSRPDFFGIHDALDLESYGRLDFGSIRLWDAGVTWRDIETSPGVYDWSRLDTLVRAAQAHHTEVTLVLAMTPSFYAGAPSLPADRPRPLPRLRPRGDDPLPQLRGPAAASSAYQVWNEGNVSDVLDRYACPAGPADADRRPGARAGRPGRHRRGAVLRGTAARRSGAGCRRTRRSGSAAGRSGSYYDVDRAQPLPEGDVRRAHRRTRGRRCAMLGDVPAPPRAPAYVPATPLWATEINYGLRPVPRRVSRRDPDLGAAPGRQRDPHLPARRRPRARPDVLVPLRLGPAARPPAVARSATPCSPIPDAPRDHPAGDGRWTTAEGWLRGRLVGRTASGRAPATRGAPTPASSGTPVASGRSCGTRPARSRRVPARERSRERPAAVGRPSSRRQPRPLTVGLPAR